MGKSSLDSNVYDFPLVRGRIAITIVDTVNRQQISYIEQDNLITTEGLNAIAAGVTGTSLTPFYVMVGTGTTTPTLADTGLATADVTTWKSFRNLGHVHILETAELNTYDVLVSDYVVFSKSTLPDVED